MVASTLDDGDGTRVTYAKALADLTIDEEFAARSAVEASVTGDNVLFSLEFVAAANGRQD